MAKKTTRGATLVRAQIVRLETPEDREKRIEAAKIESARLAQVQADRAEAYRTRHRRRLVELGAADLSPLEDGLAELVKAAVAATVAKLLPDLEDPWEWSETDAVVDAVLADGQHGTEEHLAYVVDVAENVESKTKEDLENEHEKACEEVRREAEGLALENSVGEPARILAAGMLGILGIVANDGDSSAVRELRTSAEDVLHECGGGFSLVDPWDRRVLARPVFS